MFDMLSEDQNVCSSGRCLGDDVLAIQIDASILVEVFQNQLSINTYSIGKQVFDRLKMILLMGTVLNH